LRVLECREALYRIRTEGLSLVDTEDLHSDALHILFMAFRHGQQSLSNLDEE
jgi:hypothetical protein